MRRRIAVFLSLLLLVTGFAIPNASAGLVAGIAYRLMSATSQTADTNGTPYIIDTPASSAIARLVWTNNSGSTPTLDVTIQHSPDCSAWSTLESFLQKTTGNGTEDIHINRMTTTMYPCLRAVTDLEGSSPNYNVAVTFFVGDK